MSIDRDILYNPYNLLLLAAATGLSAIFLTPLPLIIGIVGEVIWIGFLVRRGHKSDAPSSGRGVVDMSIPVCDDPDCLALTVKARADASPTDAGLRTLLSGVRSLSSKVRDFEEWRGDILSEIEGIVESAKVRYDERCLRASLIATVPVVGESLQTEQLIRFAGAIEGIVDLDYIPDQRGTTQWIASCAAIGRACLENELSQIASRRAHALYESERDDLICQSEGILATHRRLNSLARLAVNIGCELEMLSAAGRRVARDLPSRSPGQLSSDLSAVLMHAASLVRSSGKSVHEEN